MNWEELVSKGPIVALLVYAQPDLLSPGDWNAAAARFMKFVLAIGGAYLGSLLRPRASKKKALLFSLIMLLVALMLLAYLHLLNTPPRVDQVRVFNWLLIISFGLFFLGEGYCVGEIVAFLFIKVGALGAKKS